MRRVYHMNFRHRLTRSLLGFGLALVMSTSRALELPAPFTAEYQVATAGLVVAKMTRRYSHESAGGYRYESLVISTGLAAAFKPLRVEESSTGLIVRGDLQPRRYHLLRQSGKKRREVTAEFDPVKGTASGTTYDRPWQVALAGAHDNLSYLIALMRDAVQPSSPLGYRVLDAGKLREYQVTREGAETLEFERHPVQTQKLAYTDQAGRRTTLWVAAEFEGLPLRIAYREKDGVTTIATLLSRHTGAR